MIIVLSWLASSVCASLIFPPFLTNAVLARHQNPEWAREKFTEATRALVAFNEKIDYAQCTCRSLPSIRQISYEPVLEILSEIDCDSRKLFDQYLVTFRISKLQGFQGFMAGNVSKLVTMDYYLKSIQLFIMSPRLEDDTLMNSLEYDLRCQWLNLALEFWYYKSLDELVDDISTRLSE